MPIDYSKWDKLADSLGEDYEDEDEDARKQWMSRCLLSLRSSNAEIQEFLTGGMQSIKNKESNGVEPSRQTRIFL